MQFFSKKHLMLGVSCVILSNFCFEPAAADTASDIAMLKARLRQLEAQVAKDKKEAQAKAAQAKNVNNGAQSAAHGVNAPPPEIGRAHV